MPLKKQGGRDPCRNHRFDSSVAIVKSLLLIGRTNHDVLGYSELTIEHVSEILNLSKKIVIQSTVELGYPLGRIDVGNAILVISAKLPLNLPLAIPCLLPTLLSTNHVGKLNNHVKFARSILLIYNVEHIKFSY